MKVLIVDDERSLLKMYHDRFEMDNHEVFTATDGHTGIALAKSQKPDVILLDIIMPKYNGLDVLAEIKNDPEIGKIPVFLLTNLPAECSEDKANQLGAAGYLVKAENEPKKVLDIITQSFQKPENS